MEALHILHLEDNATDSQLLQFKLSRHGITSDIQVATTKAEYQYWLTQNNVDIILSDSGVPDLSGTSAWAIARQEVPHTPFVFVSNHIDDDQALNLISQGVEDYIRKDQLWRLVALLQKLGAKQPAAAHGQPAIIPPGHHHAPTEPTQPTPLTENARNAPLEYLVQIIQELSLAHTLNDITAIVRRAARALTGADGATFVLREGDLCYYADEDAIQPLWKGQRFSKDICIGGWCMENKQHVVIEDVFEDVRIPYEAYRPTFIKSLVMVPIRTENPIGAIGTYWASNHHAQPEEIKLLQALADTTAVAMENVQVHVDLENRIRNRTNQLQTVNQELMSFSSNLSHDLRSPLTIIRGFSSLLMDQYGDQLDKFAYGSLAKIDQCAARMNALIDQVLGLYQFSQQDIQSQSVNLSELARNTLSSLEAINPERQIKWQVDDNMVAQGDPLLLGTVLENLLSNAWKFSSKCFESVISVGVATRQQDTITFFVRDNGAGFDMASADKLFQPFNRLHQTKDFTGNGVGLASVQRIIHRHGGQIWAKSVVGQGATFYVSLPVQAMAAKAPLQLV
ncbi:ATP-binding protein [Leptothoe kymatousa]|uniref:histidine kinase n=1 Tax=Leptothoe kymatousa TAU-MAC 1615 TaxID=2364775 RepID=A0ABS5Y7C0_9CYAN|nr:ATP-binding protein [Leptothoe kymatousa]MBT9313244.1 GAF domain-containing protein [Leptothoe kymatousa TAU-MAC 1615]